MSYRVMTHKLGTGTPQGKRPRRAIMATTLQALSNIGDGSLNHLVGSQQHRLGDLDIKRLGGLQFDHQRKLRGLLDGQGGTPDRLTARAPALGDVVALV